MHAGPVCLADELALPHARTEAVSRLVLGVARVREGVAFDAQHAHVRLIFLIGTPRENVTEYLRVAAALTRLLRAPAARKALLAAKDEAEFRALLSAGAAAQR
jgi:mannitol/fructose-specific phosphotransferase system IIA component (Ntr-type)